jgi:hypothetical protein
MYRYDLSLRGMTDYVVGAILLVAMIAALVA